MKETTSGVSINLIDSMEWFRADYRSLLAFKFYGIDMSLNKYLTVTINFIQ